MRELLIDVLLRDFLDKTPNERRAMVVDIEHPRRFDHSSVVEQGLRSEMIDDNGRILELFQSHINDPRSVFDSAEEKDLANRAAAFTVEKFQNEDFFGFTNFRNPFSKASRADACYRALRLFRLLKQSQQAEVVKTIKANFPFRIKFINFYCHTLCSLFDATYQYGFLSRCPVLPYPDFYGAEDWERLKEKRKP